VDRVVLSQSVAETRLLGFELGQQLPPNSIVCFFGDLGAGKTTFIQGLTSGATGSPPEEVNSPTYVYLNIYEGEKPIYHFDLYRLRDGEEFLSMGFEEFFQAGGICCVEWAEKIVPILPPDCLWIRMSHQAEEQRQIEIGCLKAPNL
jgi:tRNA threonylcarbamoyladenosine biosynthesis protein TsaE